MGVTLPLPPWLLPKKRLRPPKRRPGLLSWGGKPRKRPRRVQHRTRLFLAGKCPPTREEKPDTDGRGAKDGNEKGAEDCGGGSDLLEKQICGTLSRARKEIPSSNLTEIGITELSVKWAVILVGTLILEVPGDKGAAGADVLADKWRSVVAEEEGVRVTRPIKTADIRIADLNESMTPQDVATAIAECGKCDPMALKVGLIRSAPKRSGDSMGQGPC